MLMVAKVGLRSIIKFSVELVTYLRKLLHIVWRASSNYGCTDTVSSSVFRGGMRPSPLREAMAPPREEVRAKKIQELLEMVNYFFSNVELDTK